MFSGTTGPPAGDGPVRDISGATQRLKATVPDRRVGRPAPAYVIVAVRLNKALMKTRTASVWPASPKDCTSGNETRTQNACASVPIRIVSYSYTVIVPCTVLYGIPINVTYKTLSKYFIEVLSFVTPVHITQTATRVITHCSPNYTLHSRNELQNFPALASQLKFDGKVNATTDNRRVLKKAQKTWH